MKLKSGFTLVELAIVMIIIGLLIGGILKGTEMIESAKVSSTLSQVKSYQAAVYNFRDTYASLPGDIPNATERVPGCEAGASGTYCRDGGGNSLVDDGVGGNVSWGAKIVGNPAWYETIQFWKHLILADLVTGVTTDANPDTDVAWGETHPAAKTGGGFEFYYDNWMASGGGAAGVDFSAHVLRLSTAGAAGTSGGTAIGPVGARAVSPLRAFQMDTKVDDGDPNSGTVLANYGVGISDDECKNVNGYMAQERRKNCVMYFILDK